MKNYTPGLFIFVLFLSAFTGNRPVSVPTKVNEITAAKIRNAEVKWLTMEEALKLSAKKPKKIFVDVYTDWCGWCKKMDKTTMRDPKISAYLNEQYYAVKLDAESTKKLTYKGKEITEGFLATNVFKATGFPTTVYLDENQNLLQPVSGYLEVDMLNKILHYYGENHYKTTTWEKFQHSFSMDSN